MSESRYLFGHSAAELERLEWQAGYLRPYTERLLAEAGIGPGMRVLDVGCGAGDVTLLVADRVGPTGSVVGIDRSAQAVAFATDRAGSRDRVDFVHAALADFADATRFDAVIGRYVLLHQKEPVEFLRSAARQLRPGGVLALHETDPQQGGGSLPLVPLWHQIFDWLGRAFDAVGALPHVASRLFECFADAGLPSPRVSCERPIGGGPESPLYRWLADTVRSMLPVLETIGVDPAEVDVDTLADRLREATVRSRSQLEAPGHFLAWVRL